MQCSAVCVVMHQTHAEIAQNISSNNTKPDRLLVDDRNENTSCTNYVFTMPTIQVLLWLSISLDSSFS